MKKLNKKTLVLLTAGVLLLYGLVFGAGMLLYSDVAEASRLAMPAAIGMVAPIVYAQLQDKE